MIDEKMETISAKLRSWADIGEHSFPLDAALREFEIEETAGWNDLREVFRKIADEVDAELESTMDSMRYKSLIPLDQVVGEIANGSDEYDELKEAIDRYYLPRPLFEGGEPAQFGEEFLDNGGDAHVLHEICYRDKIARGLGAPVELKATSTRIAEYDGVAYNLRNGERVKRPEQPVLLADGLPAKVGDTAYPNYGRVGQAGTILEIRNQDNVRVGFSDGKDERFNGKYLTHEKPVLDVDGVPIEVGDELWSVEGDGPWTVIAPLVGTGRTLFDDGGCARPDWLTHREPDTQERIDEDATMPSREYYAKYIGHDVGLKDDEKVWTAVTAHLLRRQRELDGRDS